MPEPLTETEKRILSVIQHGMPLTPTPYADMAEKAGIDTDEFLEILKNWQKTGIIRRTGAILNHFKTDSPAAIMVAWKVPPEKVEEVGKILAAFKQVSHAYQRKTTENWPYNLYTMIHGSNTDELDALVKEMSKAVKIDNYQTLPTIKELKKVPPTYI